MKYLLMLFIIVSCGKHQMPVEKDLRDSDGDGQVNANDTDQFKAEIITVEEIKATLDFEVGQSTLIKHRFDLSNDIDLTVYSKDLMVKEIRLDSKDDFFSEFSALKIRNKKGGQVILNGTTRVQLNFSKVQSAPRSIFLITKNKRIRLGDWKESMELLLSQDDMELILAGESYLSLSHMDVKAQFQSQTQEQNIKQKTYRVFYNDGKKTEIHYISKELSLHEILNKFNITHYKFIQEQNLLTTTIKPQLPEWWVRLNQNDVIIINENLRDLSNHYLKGFIKSRQTASRLNGFAKNKVIIKNPINTRVLLKIRADQTQATYTEAVKNHQVRIGGDSHDRYGCMDHFRSLSAEFKTEFAHAELGKSFLVNGQLINENTKTASTRRLSDEVGNFWEIELSGAESYEITLVNLPATNYIPMGLFKSVDCIGTSRNAMYRNNLQVLERSLHFQIEAFVENVKE